MKKIAFFKYLFSMVFMFSLAFAHADPVLTKLWESKADFKLPESVAKRTVFRPNIPILLPS